MRCITGGTLDTVLTRGVEVPACEEVKKSKRHDDHGTRKLGMTWASFNGRSFFPSSALSKRGRENDERDEEEDADTNAFDGFYPSVDRDDDPRIPEDSQYPDQGEGDDARRQYTPRRRFQPREPSRESEALRFANVCACFFYKGTLPSSESDRNKLFSDHPLLADEDDVDEDEDEDDGDDDAGGPRSMMHPSARAERENTHGFISGSMGDGRLIGRIPTVALRDHVAKIPRATLFNKDPSVPADVDMVGHALADFLSEVATVAVRDCDTVLKDHRDSPAVTDKSIPDTMPRTVEHIVDAKRDNVVGEFCDMLRRMKRHDPFFHLQFNLVQNREQWKEVVAEDTSRTQPAGSVQPPDGSGSSDVMRGGPKGLPARGCSGSTDGY